MSSAFGNSTDPSLWSGTASVARFVNAEFDSDLIKILTRLRTTDSVPLILKNPF